MHLFHGEWMAPAATRGLDDRSGRSATGSFARRFGNRLASQRWLGVETRGGAAAPPRRRRSAAAQSAAINRSAKAEQRTSVALSINRAKS